MSISTTEARSELQGLGFHFIDIQNGTITTASMKERGTPDEVIAAYNADVRPLNIGLDDTERLQGALDAVTPDRSHKRGLSVEKIRDEVAKVESWVVGQTHSRNAANGTKVILRGGTSSSRQWGVDATVVEVELRASGWRVTRVARERVFHGQHVRRVHLPPVNHAWLETQLNEMGR